MTTSLVPFSNGAYQIRAFTGDDGEPRFVGKDICDALEIRNVSQALAGLDDDEKEQVSATITSNDGRPGHGAQSVLVITEPGLYSLILRSRKPEAKAFKRWITHEVLPSLRKHGIYSVEPKAARKAPRYRGGLPTTEFLREAQQMGLKRVPSKYGDFEFEASGVQYAASLVQGLVDERVSKKEEAIMDALKYIDKRKIEADEVYRQAAFYALNVLQVSPPPPPPVTPIGYAGEPDAWDKAEAERHRS